MEWLRARNRAAKLREAARQESEPALISANCLFPCRKPRKRISQFIFSGRYELWQLRSLGKSVDLSQNNNAVFAGKRANGFVYCPFVITYVCNIYTRAVDNMSPS